MDKAKCFIKKGDKIIMIKAKSSSKIIVGLPVEVTKDQYKNDGYVYVVPIKEKDKEKFGQQTFYLTDEWT